MRWINKYWPYIMCAIFWAAILFLLCSCKTKYVPVPEYHTEYITKTDSFIQRDSIYKTDSVYMWLKGDTVYKEKYTTVYKDKWREKYVCDTLIKTDSIRVPYPVEKQLTKWQKIKMDVGEYLIAISFILLLALALIKGRK